MKVFLKSRIVSPFPFPQLLATLQHDPLLLDFGRSKTSSNYCKFTIISPLAAAALNVTLFAAQFDIFTQHYTRSSGEIATESHQWCGTGSKGGTCCGCFAAAARHNKCTQYGWGATGWDANRVCYLVVYNIFFDVVSGIFYRVTLLLFKRRGKCLLSESNHFCYIKERGLKELFDMLKLMKTSSCVDFKASLQFFMIRCTLKKLQETWKVLPFGRHFGLNFKERYLGECFGTPQK